MYHYVGRSVALAALGAEQRSNPLPPGSYWVDVFGDNRPKMAAWASTNRSAVQVLSTTTVGTDDSDPSTYDEYTFRVSSPVQWDAVTFGYPEIVVQAAPTTKPAPAATSKPTVATAPSPSGVKPPAQQPLSTNSTVLVIGAVAVIGLTIAVAILHKPSAA